VALLIFNLLQLASPWAFADYRAFQLQILKDGQKVREVIINLDHLQYPEYYPLNPGETVEYIESWMCRGRFDEETPYCPNPKSGASETSNSQAAKG
jgi:hypothetical protein